MARHWVGASVWVGAIVGLLFGAMCWAAAVLVQYTPFYLVAIAGTILTLGQFSRAFKLALPSALEKSASICFYAVLCFALWTAIYGLRSR